MIGKLPHLVLCLPVWRAGVCLSDYRFYLPGPSAESGTELPLPPPNLPPGRSGATGFYTQTIFSPFTSAAEKDIAQLFFQISSKSSVMDFNPFGLL